MSNKSQGDTTMLVPRSYFDSQSPRCRIIEAGCPLESSGPPCQLPRPESHPCDSDVIAMSWDPDTGIVKPSQVILMYSQG